MTRHTPGPWKQVGATEVWSEAGYSKIAQTHGAYTPHSKAINQANARLIAAAPELLAALEAVFEAGRMSDQPRAKYCAEIARAALAKAKGE